MSNKMYDAAKWLAMIGLPAVGALYFGLAAIWGLPEADRVVGSITVIDLFLGTVLGLASRSYNKSDARYDGAMDVHETDEKLIYGLELTTPPEELAGKKEVVFKLQPRHIKPYDE